MPHYDFTADNLGSPDQYTVNSVCKRISIQEKDRTVAMLAKYRVYRPVTSATYKQRLIGEEHIVYAEDHFYPGDKPFAIETVGVATTVFTVDEQ